MVCNHCVAAVRKVFKDAGIEVISVDLGRVETAADLSVKEIRQLSHSLASSGFELILDPAKELVEAIKREIINLVRSDKPAEEKLSDFLSAKLHRDFRSLSRIFSDIEGRTIENYAILQKIERVKELLVDGQLTISEIAWRTGYSSVAHLSRQFKNITGMTPSVFRRDGRRIPLNEV